MSYDELYYWPGWQLPRPEAVRYMVDPEGRDPVTPLKSTTIYL